MNNGFIYAIGWFAGATAVFLMWSVDGRDGLVALGVLALWFLGRQIARLLDE